MSSKPFWCHLQDPVFVPVPVVISLCFSQSGATPPPVRRRASLAPASVFDRTTRSPKDSTSTWMPASELERRLGTAEV